MQLTKDQITIVLQLQADFHRFTEEIKHLEKTAAELAKDPCDVKVNFSCHNLNQHQINEELKKVKMPGESEVDGDIIVQQFQGLAMILSSQMAHAMGLKTSGQPQPEKECVPKINFSCTEATGIRIINAILQEKYEARDLTQKQIEDILIPKLKIDINQVEVQNPIHELYSR